MGGWWRWALVGPDGVAPSRMVGVSASVNLPLYYKVQKFCSDTGSPRWSRKKGRKTVVVVVDTVLQEKVTEACSLPSSLTSSLCTYLVSECTYPVTALSGVHLPDISTEMTSQLGSEQASAPCVRRKQNCSRGLKRDGMWAWLLLIL